MRISSLRYFYEVAQLKSISKVSTNLHISQPALSHQLFKLEKEFGVKIFERSNRGVELTEKGKILYNYAKEIILLYDNLIDNMKDDNDDTKEIRIKISNLYGSFAINKMSNKIVEIFKNKDVHISNDYSISEKALLLNNKADITIGCNEVEDIDLLSKYIGKGRFILVSKDYIDESQIQNMQIGLLDDGLNLSTNLNSKIRDKNIHLKTDSLEAIKNYILNDNCVALVPKIAIEDDLKLNKIVNLEAQEYEWDYDIFITYKKDISSDLKINIQFLIDKLVGNLSNEEVLIAR